MNQIVIDRAVRALQEELKNQKDGSSSEEIVRIVLGTLCPGDQFNGCYLAKDADINELCTDVIGAFANLSEELKKLDDLVPAIREAKEVMRECAAKAVEGYRLPGLSMPTKMQEDLVKMIRELPTENSI